MGGRKESWKTSLLSKIELRLSGEEENVDPGFADPSNFNKRRACPNAVSPTFLLDAPPTSIC